MVQHRVIAQGRTAELLEYDHGRVVKLFRKSIPDDFIETEFKISKRIFTSGVPTPQPYNIISLENRKGIVYEKASGMTMLQTIQKKPLSIKKEANRMAKLHVEIHSKDVFDLPKQKDILAKRIDHTSLLTLDEKENIKGYLNELKEGSNLCHGDFHPDNIIIGNKEWIIDWMTGMSGNPAGDVARTILLLKVGSLPDGVPKIVEALLGFFRKILLNIYLKNYLRNSKLSLEEIEQWILPVAAARLVEGVPESEKQQLVKIIKEKLYTSIKQN